MSNIDDYDILSNLGSDSCFYKVKNKTTAEVCIWRTINVEPYTDQQLKLLLKAINDEKQFRHNNTVQVFSHILNETTKTLYIVTKYYKYGNLKNVIELCNKRHEILSETFLWRLLYNVICVLKLKGCHGLISLESIFVDADFVVKIYHLDVASRPSSVAKCISSVGTILYQLCNLQSKPTKIKLPIGIQSHYSDRLLTMITLLLKSSKKINYDHILCHPTVLLKSAEQGEVFIKPLNNNHPENPTEYQFLSCKCEMNYKLQLENLQSKEATLKSLQQKLNEKDSVLRKREKMLIAMENSLKEKLRQADIYLRKVKQTNTVIRRKATYEDIDTTLSAAECDDSVILPTSAKINLNAIKSSNFSRSLSERRIRFKGHSPLKDMCNINRNANAEKPHETFFENVKCKKTVSFTKLNKRKSKLFEEEAVEKDENDEVPIRSECRPISWSEEAKRQAFDMLRVMNAAETGQGFMEMKHTHL